jgi:predicted amidohydrolase
MTSGIDPAEPTRGIVSAARRRSGGAAMLFTPEMSGLLDRDRKRALRSTSCRRTRTACWPRCARQRRAGHLGRAWLAGHRARGRALGQPRPRDRFRGAIAARYDKIHMFDVDLATGESWRESNAYAAGNQRCDGAHAAWPAGLVDLL